MINLENETMLRIFVMTQIQHPEEYYQAFFKDKGFELKDLTHADISVFKSAMLALEADSIIHAAKNLPAYDIDKFEDDLVSKLKQMDKGADSSEESSPLGYEEKGGGEQ